jgi:hypothetical protein
MGKNDVIAWLEEITWPPIRDLDRAPSSDEGNISEVLFDHERGTARPTDARACQECGDSVQIAEPHVTATVWLYSEMRSGPNMKMPVFCDRECWRSWASS